MSFNVINAELQVPTDSSDCELLKLRLSDTLRGLIECTEQGLQSCPDVDKKIKALVSDVDKLKCLAAQGMEVFLNRVFN